MNTTLRKLQLLLLAVGITTGCFLTGGCDKKGHPAPAPPATEPEVSPQESVKARPPAPQPKEPAKPEWGVVAHFGMTTTVWISDRALGDKFHVAQILHEIDRKYGAGIVWFFDSKQHAARGVPMTDGQLLHWVGLYDPAQSETFSYVEVTDPNASPKTVKTTIRPGYAG